jgi:hypothetical protein
VIERDAQPRATIRAAIPTHRTISDCLTLAEAHESETGELSVLDPDLPPMLRRLSRPETADAAGVGLIQFETRTAAALC